MPYVSPIRFEYYAYVANCSEDGLFRSSMEECQTTKINDKAQEVNKVDVGEVGTCYIEDCSTGEFVWGFDVEGYYSYEKRQALWMIIPTAVIVGISVCSWLCVLVS